MTEELNRTPGATAQAHPAGLPGDAANGAEPCDGQHASVGWQGLFRVSTRLMGDREIDVDDREANLLFTLEMKAVAPWEFHCHNLHVVLKIDPADPSHRNIAIHGVTAGELVLFHRDDGHHLAPGSTLSRQLKIATGAFSSHRFTAQPALPGLKHYAVEIEYDLEPAAGNAENTTQTQLLFPIAAD